MKKNKILKTLVVINEMSERFPMLKVNEINFQELAKFYGVDTKDLKVGIVFLDALKQANRQSVHAYYVDVNEIDRIKINRKDEEWTFHVYRSKSERISISHNFKF